MTVHFAFFCFLGVFEGSKLVKEEVVGLYMTEREGFEEEAAVLIWCSCDVAIRATRVVNGLSGCPCCHGLKDN